MPFSWYIRRLKTFSAGEFIFRIRQRLRTHVLDKHVMNTCKKKNMSASVNLPRSSMIDDVSEHLDYPIFEKSIDVFKKINWNVTKPQAQSASQLEKENLLIAITREGTIHMNERQVDLASLQDILKQSLAKAPDREAVVIADKGSETGVLVQVIDMCNLAGVKKVSIAAQAE